MSDADNERVTLDEVVVLAPLLMEMLGLVGAVVSATIRVIESEELEETLPNVSFNQRLTVFVKEPAAPVEVKVKLTVLERLLVEVMSTQPVAVALGSVEVSEA